MADTTQAMDRLLDYDVVDTEGNKVGSIENIWVDGATEQLEFVAVKTGRLLGKTHIVPVADARIDEANRQVRVPYREGQIKDAPHIDHDAELSDEDEQRVYDHYGVERSTAPSPTGLAGDAGTTGERRQAARTTDRDRGAGGADARPDMTGQDRQNIPLAEEQLRVGKREEEAGRARLRKVVRTEHVSQPVELRREEVRVERVPVSGQDAPPDAFQEQEIEVPVSREEPTVEKEARVTEQARVEKTAQTERRTVEGDVRREDVELDRERS